MQPVFGSRWLGVPEVIGELVGTAFYLFEDTFDDVPIAVGEGPKSKAESMERGVAPRC